MFPNENVFRSVTDTFVFPEPNLVRGVSEIKDSIGSPAKNVVQDFAAELIFPAVDYSLPVLVESTWTFEEQRLTLRLELDEGAAFEWQMIGKPVEKETKVILEGTAGINLVSPRPRAHYIAATIQSLLMMDESSVLRVNGLGFSGDMHFASSPKMVSDFLRRRQIAYRLMVIEKAFKREFSIPPQISDEDVANIDFVYRVVMDRVFSWPFYQDSFEILANDRARKLLTEMEGKHPFEIEIGCLQQALLGRTLNLGQAKMTVQNAALVNPEEVERELQKLDGRSFRVFIKSFSGLANYQFLDAPGLPDDAWDKLVAELIELDEKLVSSLFKAVNELAAGSLADLTEEEKSEATIRPQFD
ncbi:MAG: hypothetical protein ACREAB_15230 [Blastocatellia bacterium]